MTPEQKKRAAELLTAWRATAYALHGDAMTALLQELINAPEEVLTTTNQAKTSSSQVEAPEPEPFGYFKAEPFGWTDCAETDDGAIALFAAPPAPSVPDGWKHDCAGIMQNDVELWLDSCPHCGKPKTDAAPTPAEAPADVARDAERLRLFEQWTEMGYEHTKEPRFEVETESDVIEITNDERNGAIVPIAEVSTGFNGQIGIEQEANARRIVACVNACEGIPTGVLEKQGMVPIEQVTHDIEQQRDKLLAALTEIAELDILKYHHAYAIAKGAIEEIEALK